MPPPSPHPHPTPADYEPPTSALPSRPRNQQQKVQVGNYHTPWRWALRGPGLVRNTPWESIWKSDGVIPPSWSRCDGISDTNFSTPQRGIVDSKITVPSAEEDPELSPFQAWGRSVYSHGCLACCRTLFFLSSKPHPPPPPSSYPCLS